MSIDEIVAHYDAVVKVLDNNAKAQNNRAYGGVIREVKGALQEFITEQLVTLAWESLGGANNRLEINSKKIKIPIKDDYIECLKDKKVRDYIKAHKEDYYYELSVDKHIFIDGNFVMGIECKAYTENAMIKRILVDFHMLKTLYPSISCHLFQLESQLGGDYSALPQTVYGSSHTHSIMSYFPDVHLYITTLLRGERKIDKPIHKYFKRLEKSVLEKAVTFLQGFLKEFK